MAIYHCSVKNISRGSGKSAVASASYRSGEKLQDERQGLTFQYKKNEVAYSEIFLCENAPKEYADRGALWNAVEQVEKQSNSRLAREWEVAIPNELTLQQSKELIKEFAQSLADEGMCIDANIHWKDGNHHAHIMGTTRPIKENGEWGQKEKKVYKLDENGEKIPQLDENGQQKIGAKGRKMWERKTVEVNDWNRTEKLKEWRERWKVMTNKALERANIQERVSSKSYEERGIEKIPTIHEGHVARKLEKKGKISERCQHNREVAEKNSLIEKITAQIRNLNAETQSAEQQLAHQSDPNDEQRLLDGFKLAYDRQTNFHPPKRADGLTAKALKRSGYNAEEQEIICRAFNQSLANMKISAKELSKTLFQYAREVGLTEKEMLNVIDVARTITNEQLRSIKHERTIER